MNSRNIGPISFSQLWEWKIKRFSNLKSGLVDRLLLKLVSGSKINRLKLSNKTIVPQISRVRATQYLLPIISIEPEQVRRICMSRSVFQQSGRCFESHFFIKNPHLERVVLPWLRNHDGLSEEELSLVHSLAVMSMHLFWLDLLFIQVPVQNLAPWGCAEEGVQFFICGKGHACDGVGLGESHDRLVF